MPNAIRRSWWSNSVHWSRRATQGSNYPIFQSIFYLLDFFSVFTQCFMARVFKYQSSENWRIQTQPFNRFFWVFCKNRKNVQHCILDHSSKLARLLMLIMILKLIPWCFRYHMQRLRAVPFCMPVFRESLWVLSQRESVLRPTLES